MCDCDRPGKLSLELTPFLIGAPMADPEQVGRGAWIYCNRGMAALESAIEGMPTAHKAAFLRGAHKEREASQDGP